MKLQAVRVVVGQVGVHFGNQFCVMGAIGIEPKHGRVSRGACAVHGKLHPVLNRGVLDLTHPEQITGAHLLAHDDFSGGVDHVHATG